MEITEQRIRALVNKEMLRRYGNGKGLIYGKPEDTRIVEQEIYRRLYYHMRKEKRRAYLKSIKLPHKSR